MLTNTYQFFRNLGIRTSFLLGFWAVVFVLVVSVVITVIGTRQMSSETQVIIATQLPDTLKTLAVARAADSLVAASGRLISITQRSAMNDAFERVNASQEELRKALDNLDLTSKEAKQVLELSVQLRANLDIMRESTEYRIELLERAQSLQQSLLDNQQTMQQFLTYRVRILNSDGDIIRALMAKPNPPLEQVQKLVTDNVPYLSVSQFYAEVAAIHSRLLAATSTPTLLEFSLSRELLRGAFDYANYLLETMPIGIREKVSPLLLELSELAFADDGLFALHAAELTTVTNIQRTIEASQQISSDIDHATTLLVQNGLKDIEQSAAHADNTRSFYTIVLIGFASFGLIVVGLFFVLHVNRHLIQRLSELSQAMISIAQGKYDISLPPTGHDELGRLGEAVSLFHASQTQLEHANQQLSELSRVDSLTGLANRRRFDEVIATEWSLSEGANTQLSLIMIDLDFFKEFNDLYGHQQGDECLRQIGIVLHRSVQRISDLPARYGGEEFCVVLPNTTVEDAIRVAERIRKLIHQLDIPHQRSPSGHVTASFGVATCSASSATDYHVLVRAADRALYAAKHHGRDCVVQYQSELN